MDEADGVLIIGNSNDEHAVAVVDAIGERAQVSLLDASGLSEARWRWSDGLVVAGSGGWCRPRRGWLRRLAPPDWHHGIEIGTLRGVEAHAKLHLLAAAADSTSGIEWLTDYWTMMRAENKLVQDQVAKRAGIPVPSTRVATQVEDLWDLDDTMVMKPLGLGSYTAVDGTAMVLPSRAVHRFDPALRGLSAAPYIAQQQLEAARHLRIPTVQNRSWPCQLDATDLPLDWRTEEAAHRSWEACDQAEPAGALAVAVARELDLGYSSQDWIEDVDGKTWLVDVNPAGQWLFLPSDVATAVTEGIGDWLVGGS